MLNLYIRRSEQLTGTLQISVESKENWHKHQLWVPKRVVEEGDFHRNQRVDPVKRQRVSFKWSIKRWLARLITKFVHQFYEKQVQHLMNPDLIAIYNLF